MAGLNAARGEIARITDAAVERGRRGEPLGPCAIVLLVRQYRAGRDGVGDVLGDALARALDRYGDDRALPARARWVTAFAEAAGIAEDERLADAARAGIDALLAEWPSLTIVGDAAASIDACLTASTHVNRIDVVPSVVDALERLVAAAYQPGDGVSHTLGGARARGDASDHVRAAAALLSGFDLSGRLPYSMLAEELMRTACPPPPAAAHASIACDAVRVLCRLAHLHDDPQYRSAAVVAPGADYRADAQCVVARAADQLRTGARDPDEESLYAIALSELIAARVAG